MAAVRIATIQRVYEAFGRGDVMVIHFEMKIPTTGRRGAMRLHHWWRLHDGEVWHYRGTEDTALTGALVAT